MIQLFIENTEIELDKKVDFAITKLWEDLTNPTTIINDWSKTIEIPFTKKNNETFGHIYLADRMIVVPLKNYIEQIGYSDISNCSFNEDNCRVLYNTTGNTDAALTKLLLYVYKSDGTVQTYYTLPTNAGAGYNLNFHKSALRSKFRLLFTGNTQNGYIDFDFANLEEADYTFSVEIKQVSLNSALVKHIQLLRSTGARPWSETHSNIGLYFDPMKKLDFRLEYDGSIVMTGYAKMNRVNKVNGTGTYNITLNGTLGKVLLEMLKITFDESKNDSDHYYILPSESFGEAIINKELVYNCWTGNTTDTTLQWIGFAPNNSFNDEFDYKSFQYLDPNDNLMKIIKFTDTLGTSSSWQSLHIDADSIIGDGMLPKDIGEYRSYLQIPYIKFPKFWELFLNKAEAVTKYQFELDSAWFNSSNPLWKDEVMIAKAFDFSKLYENVYGLSTNIQTIFIENESYGQLYTNNISCSTSSESIPIIQGTTPFTVNISDYSNVVINDAINLLFSVYFSTEQYFPRNYDFCGFWHYTGMVVYVDLVDAVTNAKIYRTALCLHSSPQEETPLVNFAPHITDADKVEYLWFWLWDNITPGCTKTIDKSFTFTDIFRRYPNNIQLKLSYKWISDYTPSIGYEYPLAMGTYSSTLDDRMLTKFNFNINVLNTSSSTIKINKAKSSNSLFTLNDLWNNDVLPYDVIVNYCKIHRILILIDDTNKKIKFTPAWKYFENYTIENWTDKIDMSNDYLIIVPCSFDNKYVLFNYEDSKTKLGKDYKDKFGVDYGEMNLITDYNFNTETKNLFDKPIQPSITYSDNNLSWNDLINGKVRYVIPTDILIYSLDEDKKFVSNFGALYIYKGVVNFDANNNFRFRLASLTDDTDFMILNNTYCYSQNISSSYINVNSYPLLDVVSNTTMCIYNKPKLNYTYNSAAYNNAQGVYQKLWSNYLAERYYSGNKKITCFLWIKPQDFILFQFNRFVKIENQLYFVNKIYDYAINENVTTKVDLISVNDITKYYTIN